MTSQHSLEVRFDVDATQPNAAPDRNSHPTQQLVAVTKMEHTMTTITTKTDVTKDPSDGPFLRNSTEEFTASHALKAAFELLARPGHCRVIYAEPKAGAEAVQRVKYFLSSAGAEVTVDDDGTLKLFN